MAENTLWSRAMWLLDPCILDLALYPPALCFREHVAVHVHRTLKQAALSAREHREVAESKLPSNLVYFGLTSSGRKR